MFRGIGGVADAHATENSWPEFYRTDPVAFMKGKAELFDADIRFLTRSLKEDFSLAGIPIRILQHPLLRHDENSKDSNSIRKSRHVPKLAKGSPSDKRQVAITMD
ncbi:hypothetical protein Droror1_Dr00014783 [Drosera rotundifolia]